MMRAAPRLIELRALPWGSVAVLVLLAVAGLTTDLSGALDGPGSSLMWFALGALGAAAAFVLDSPAATVVAATPIPERERVAVRMLLPGGLILVWLAFVGLASGRDAERPVSVLGLAVTGIGLVAATVAAVCVVRRMGHPEPGALVSPVVLFAVLAALFVQPLPGHVVVLQTGPLQGSSLAFWCATGVVVVCALAWGSVDRRHWS